MIADPCNAKLVPSIFGSNYGLLARFRRNYTFPAPYSTAAYGYVLWFPSAHNNLITSIGTYSTGNFFVFGAGSPSFAPVLLDYGYTSTTNTNAQSFKDPAYDFVNGDTCADARTISACLKLTYTGAQSACKGLIAPITNLPLSVALYGGTGGAPPSIDQMLTYTTQQHRPLEDSEAVWRVDATDSTFKSTVTPVIESGSGVPATLSSAAEVRPPTGIGFVFYNVTSAADFNIAAFKNVEWRSEPSSGLTLQQPTGSENPSYIASAMNFLDSRFPGWQQKTKDTAINVLGNALTNMALGGSYKSGAADSTPNYVKMVTRV